MFLNTLAISAIKLSPAISTGLYKGPQIRPEGCPQIWHPLETIKHFKTCQFSLLLSGPRLRPYKLLKI